MGGISYSGGPHRPGSASPEGLCSHTDQNPDTTHMHAERERGSEKIEERLEGGRGGRRGEMEGGRQIHANTHTQAQTLAFRRSPRVLTGSFDEHKV